MKRLWFFCVRAYVRLGLEFFYKKIIIKNESNIPRNEAVILVANHQNAFLDAVVIACTNHTYGHFLVRADIFKKPWAIRLLSSLNMMPAYRIRDGWQNLGKNQQTFEQCEKILTNKNAVIIFPEGNHGEQRRLRNLSKGFTRVAFESIKKHPDRKIYIVPVGLNFTDTQAFRGSVSVLYGEPILANEYFSADDVVSATRLKEEVASRLKKLITHVEDESSYEFTMKILDASAPDYLDPIDTNRRIALIQDEQKIPPVPKPVTQNSFVMPIIRFLTTLVNAVPLYFWSRLGKKIKDPVFVGSMKFVFGIFVFPLYYTLLVATIYGLTGVMPAVIAMAILIFSMPLRAICYQ